MAPASIAVTGRRQSYRCEWRRVRAWKATAFVDGSFVKGRRHSVIGADGVPIGLLTSGVGHSLLLVHGGISQIEAWEPAWDLLSTRWQVTAMDRRGRGGSGDARSYAINREYDDIAAVAGVMADQHGGPVDVLGHSYGATCTLGAAARGAAFRRVVLYEPPGSQTVPGEWVERVSTMATDGRAGQAMFSFLTEIVGLSVERVQELADQPRSYDALATVAATLPREAHALMAVDLLKDASAVTCPVLLLLGQNSPSWARDITHALTAAIANAEVAVLPGQGHEAIDSAPALVVNALERFLGGLTTPSC